MRMDEIAASLGLQVNELKEIILEGLQLSGGWREAIAELEDHCSEPVRLKNMMAALDGLDEWRKKAYSVFPKNRTKGSEHE